MIRMRTLSVFVLSLCLLAVCVPLLAQEPCTITVLPGESIQAAIDAAPEGSVICLEAGEWEENLVIEKSLTLRAAEIAPEPRAVIRSAREGWPVILIRSEKPIEVTVQGLTITGAFGDCHQWGLGSRWMCADGISVHGKATATIERNNIGSNNGNGILLWDSSRATIEGNNLSGNFAGISMEGCSQATIEANIISGSRSCGIRMGGSSEATIAGNTVSGNRVYGIGMWNSSEATIAGNTVSGNQVYGIVMSDSSLARIQGNAVSDSARYGVALYERPYIATDSVFTGYVTGRDNTGGGNTAGDFCPDALAFLFTEEGGKLDRWVAGLGALARSCPLTITVQPGESIQAAIDAANPGSMICLNPGEWEENLVIEKSLTLRAAEVGPEPRAVIRSAREGWPVIRIVSEESIDVTIQGLTITGASGWHCDLRPGPSSILLGGLGAGIVVYGRARVKIDSNTISGNGCLGILLVGSSHAIITNNTVSDNRLHGIFMDYSAATVEENTVSGSTFGIFALDCSIEIKANTISDNEIGIAVALSSEATITGNVIRDNARYGVSIFGRCYERFAHPWISAQRCLSGDSVFTGYVTGRGNTGGGNTASDFCPFDLALLFTEEGGRLDCRK